MKILKELVEIPSCNNCDDILEYIKEKLIDKVEEINIYGNKSKFLLAGINTRLRNIEPIILSGHIDTACADEKGYKTNPYILTEVDGKAYGLGSIDMKSFTAVILENINKIKSINVPIVLALTTDEETDLKSIYLLIDKLKELNIKPKFTIVGEPSKSEFGVSSNSCDVYSVKLFGKSSHSSKINEGINAICACAKLVSFVEKEQSKYRLTANCGVINGGEVFNKVADYAELIFDIRSLYKEDVNKFLNEIKKYLKKLKIEYSGLKSKLQVTSSMPPFNMLENDKIKEIADKMNTNMSMFTGGCEVTYYVDYSGDGVIFGVGDLSLAHKPNEYVVISEYYEYSKQLIRLLELVHKKYF